MCGISGIFGIEGIADPVAMVQGMDATQAHRGPDASGTWSGDQLVLGHRRLSIIELSGASNQPFVSTSGRSVLIFNGEIYNYRQLRSELQDMHFRTQSDTEVLINGYEKWGKGVLHKLNGMFAFAIWDIPAQELFIARDRLGIKPLYYHRSDHHLLFASEVRSLLSTGLVPRKLDRKALSDYMRYQTVHAPDTLVEDVKMLLPGHYMRITDDEVNIQRYWDPINDVNDPGIPEMGNATSVYGNIKRLFMASVERRLVADVPFGAFLSGGIDSTAVVGAMAQVSSEPVHTFSVVFAEKEFSEAEFARLVAKRFNTKHTEIRLLPEDFLQLIPDALGAMDHPSGDGPNTYVVSKVTREAGITMALSGLGGDELFAGYPVFRRTWELQDKRWLTSFPVGLRRLAGSLLELARPGVRSEKTRALIAQRTLGLIDSYPISRLTFTDDRLRELMNAPLAPNQVQHMMQRSIADEQGYRLPLLSQISIGEILTYLQNTLLRDTDQMSMAHALEVRVPFLDHELVQYVLAVSDGLKFPHTPKCLLVNALGDLIPDEVVHRPKMGFTLPWARWMQHELRPFCEQRSQALGSRGLLHRSELDRLWTGFLKNDPRATWSRIWYLVVLEEWMQRNGIE